MREKSDDRRLSCNPILISRDDDASLSLEQVSESVKVALLPLLLPGRIYYPASSLWLL